VIEDLGDGPVGLDTSPFIYFIERHPEFAPIVRPIFEAMAAGRIEGVTSSLSLMETLVVPFRAGDLGLVERYELLLTRSHGLRLVDLDRPLLRAAAQLRSRYRVTTPDALQLAAAILTHCSSYVTNDRGLPPVPGVRILQLRDYLTPPRVGERPARYSGQRIPTPRGKPRGGRSTGRGAKR
jgi:predicted nucleic acid-binding protein